MAQKAEILDYYIGSLLLFFLLRGVPRDSGNAVG